MQIEQIVVCQIDARIEIIITNGEIDVNRWVVMVIEMRHRWVGCNVCDSRLTEVINIVIVASACTVVQ